MMSPGYQILSRPVKVDWAGWRSDTRTLQQHGWEISAHQELENDRMAIAFRHSQMGMRGLSELTAFEYERNFHDQDYLQHVQLRISHLAGGFKLVPIDTSMQFYPIDARPQVATWKGEEFTFDNFAHFAKGFSTAKQIIMPPDEDVDQLLARILQKQEAGKQAYFEEKVRQAHRDAGPMPTVHAQIITLADRRAA